MVLPTEVRDQVDRKLEEYCRDRVPAHLSDRIRVAYEIDGVRVTLVERRAGFLGDGAWTQAEIAQFRFRPDGGTWAVYWMDSRRAWTEYGRVEATDDLEVLLKEIDRDPTGVFWG